MRRHPLRMTHADGTEEWLAMFKDPEGRPLGLISRVRPASTASP